MDRLNNFTDDKKENELNLPKILPKILKERPYLSSI